MKVRGKTQLHLIMAVLAAILLLDPLSGFARDFKGVDFPEEVKIGQDVAKLNGVGVRKKFMVTVYYGALYLQTPSKDRKQIIQADEAKEVLLHVVYKEVGADKWVEGWQEGFTNNVPSPSPELRAKMDQFLKAFDEPVKSGETVRLTYIPGKGTEVAIRDKQKAVIAGKDFMTALFSIWFGEKPASDSLMKGMLGD
jgi:hypothetical protein